MSEWSKEPDLRPGSVCCEFDPCRELYIIIGSVAQMVERTLSMRDDGDRYPALPIWQFVRVLQLSPAPLAHLVRAYA